MSMEEEAADEASSLMQEAQGPPLISAPALPYPPRPRTSRPTPSAPHHRPVDKFTRILHGRHKDAHFEVGAEANLLVFFRTMPPRAPDHLPDNPKDLEDLQEEEERASVMAHADLFAYRCWQCCTGGILDIKLVYLEMVEEKYEFRVLHDTPLKGVFSQPFEQWNFNPKEWYNVEIRLPPESHAALVRFIHKQHHATFNSVSHFMAALGCCWCCAHGVENSEIAPERNLYHPDGFMAREFRNRPDWAPAQLVAACLVHCGLIDEDVIDVNSITFKEIRRQLKTAFHQLSHIIAA